MDPDQRKKPVIVKGPYIVYMLRENEIFDDWTAIKKSLAQRQIDDDSSNWSSDVDIVMDNDDIFF